MTDAHTLERAETVRSALMEAGGFKRDNTHLLGSDTATMPNIRHLLHSMKSTQQAIQDGSAKIVVFVFTEVGITVFNRVASSIL